jgi:hypothetical protein
MLTCAGLDAESVTVTVMRWVTATWGVPEIIPDADKLRPTGRDSPPAKVHEYGATPPEAARENPFPAYGVPTVPDGRAAEVIARDGGGVLMIICG